MLTNICENADVLALCGDLTDHGLPRQADVLAEELLSCKIPLIGVLGNHDYESGQEEEVRRIITQAGVTLLDGEACEVRGVGFAGVKGFAGGFDNRMLQPWGEEIIKRFVFETVNEALRLEGALAKLRTEHTIAILHYAPIRQTVEGESPEVIPYLGCSRLAEPIDHFGVTAVFHGHAHYGSPHGKTAKQIPVFNASLPVMRRVSPKRPYVLFEV